MKRAHHVVVMGVSGSGKSTIGALLAGKLGAVFIDGDVLHSQANIAKLAAGTSLDDADRKPWLEAIGRKLAEARAAPLVVACSALKKAYRDIIRAADETVQFIFLEGPYELLSQRLADRRGHFMPSFLLKSQFETLEPLGSDEPGFALNVAGKPEDVASKAALSLTCAIAGETPAAKMRTREDSNFKPSDP